MNLILAIDPATQTGYAVCKLDRNGRILESGSHTLGKHDAGEKYSALWGLMDLIRGRAHEGTIDVIAYERAFHRGGAATRFHHGCVAIIEMFAHRIGARTIGATTSQIKATAGHGQLPKDEMISRARRVFHADVQDDNEADALFLCLWARGYFMNDQITASASRG